MPKGSGIAACVALGGLLVEVSSWTHGAGLAEQGLVERFMKEVQNVKLESKLTNISFVILTLNISTYKDLNTQHPILIDLTRKCLTGNLKRTSLKKAMDCLPDWRIML